LRRTFEQSRAATRQAKRAVHLMPHRLLGLYESQQERVPVRAFAPRPVRELGRDDDGRGLEPFRQHRFRDGGEAGVGTFDHESDSGIRHRSQLEGRLRDYRERAEAPDVELIHVVTGHIFNDPPARLAEAAVRVREPEPDHVIAHRPEAETERAARRAGDYRADRRVKMTGGVERQPLAFPERGRIQVGERRPRLHRDRQVGRAVVDDARHPSEAEHDVGAPQEVPAVEPRHESRGYH
jgi:hypothetical protein